MGMPAPRRSTPTRSTATASKTYPPTSGRGARTGPTRTTTARAPSRIRRGPVAAPIASCGAARISATTRTATGTASMPAAPTSRRARRATWASASPAATHRPPSRRPGTEAPPRAVRLLDRRRDAEALLGRDEVVVVVETGVELHPADRAVEAAALRGVVLGDGRAGGVADVAGLVAGVRHRGGRLAAASADLVAVDVQDDVSALTEASAVVGE